MTKRFRMNGLTLVGWLPVLSLSFWVLAGSSNSAEETANSFCRIEVRDSENGWPVPLVELRTVNQQRFVTDNEGVVALDQSSAMGHETWFFVSGHGYEVTADGFEFRGVRLTPQPGATLTIKVKRENISKRLGRLTGHGLFAESQKLGEHADWIEPPLVGCDSVQLSRFGGKLFWSWGDTLFANYPLGNFDMTAAINNESPFSQNRPPIVPTYGYLLNDKRLPKGSAPIAGDGPTWLGGYASLADRSGKEHLVATYRKIKPPLETYEIGKCQWDADRLEFVLHDVLWRKDSGRAEPKDIPSGHTVRWRDDSGKEWLLDGNPLPALRMPATYEAWMNRGEWQVLQPQQHLSAVNSETLVEPHSGSIAWNGFRNRWITIFMQRFGQPSAFGELWYAESESPMGPWGPAIKILTHDNYTFYNPRILWELSDPDSSMVLFEGTYTREFADRPAPTARYDYNQILYRIDLDDPRLRSVQTTDSTRR